MQPVWILVNCNSKKEVEKIGREIFGERLVSCSGKDYINWMKGELK
jgi:uncharacterized protein involved in tolerance to divalent cations